MLCALGSKREFTELVVCNVGTFGLLQGGVAHCNVVVELWPHGHGENNFGWSVYLCITNINMLQDKVVSTHFKKVLQYLWIVETF